MSETQQTTEATREIVAETMVGDLMKITLDELKLIDKPWQTLSYFQQDDIISRVQNQAQDAVRQAVQILGSGGMVRVPVQLESLLELEARQKVEAEAQVSAVNGDSAPAELSKAA